LTENEQPQPNSQSSSQKNLTPELLQKEDGNPVVGKITTSQAKLGQYPTQIWFRALLLSLSFILLIFIFSPNAVRLKDELKLEKTTTEQAQQTVNSPGNAKPAGVESLRDIEHKKANDEIKMLQEQIDTWYHYKFLLIGGIVALFLGHFGILSNQSTASPKKSEKILLVTLMSIRTSILLALICIVAFVIDMHIRAHFTGLQGLGHWVYNYVEPSYFKAIGAQTGEIPREGLVETQFIPWEMFLHSNVHQARQTSTLYRAAYSLQLHFMTIAFYMLYLVIFQNVCILCKKGKQQHQIAFLGFAMVHIAALAFIIVSHTVPNFFEVKCFPVPNVDCWLSGSQGSIYYLIAWLLLIILSLPYLYQLFPSLQSNRSHKNADAITSQ